MDLSAAALPRLLQLASPLLPVGAYSYSQGLEMAIEDGLVRDADTARAWIGDVLGHNLARFETPLLARMQAGWAAGDSKAAAHWNEVFVASRETAELRAETLQMGYSLVRLLTDLGEFPGESLAALRAMSEPGFPCGFAYTAAAWGITVPAAVHAYLWAWAENQVSAALKAVPLGQVAGQKILTALGAAIPALAEQALALEDEELSNFSPMLAIVSSRHEIQYSRLFRS